MLLIDEISLYSSVLSPSLFLSVSLCFSLPCVCAAIADLQKIVARMCISRRDRKKEESS